MKRHNQHKVLTDIVSNMNHQCHIHQWQKYEIFQLTNFAIICFLTHQWKFITSTTSSNAGAFYPLSDYTTKFKTHL